MTTPTPQSDVRTYVREHYGQIAENFQPKASSCGCGTSSSSCCGPSSDASQNEGIGVDKLYTIPEVNELPEDVTGLSLGCGDPITLASLKPGQTVLDLGSGGGIDCFLAAKKVGQSGRVIGVDMTPAMLEKARLNRQKVGLDNVEFRLGEIEHLPVADSTVDVIISNCVINLSPDKPQVFREAFRVMKPGGKLAVSDIVTDGPLPDAIKQSLSSWAGCVAGALDVKDYLAAIREAGFTEAEITPVYLPREMVDEAAKQVGEEIDLSQVSDDTLYKSVFSAKIKARKPEIS
jgi:ubiquinone/menaquinone biosynthesis C-methylase UbiE